MSQLAANGNIRSKAVTILLCSIALGLPLLLFRTHQPSLPQDARHTACAYPGMDPTLDSGEEDRRPVARSAQTPLRLLQYNVQFLLPDIALHFVSAEEIGHWPNTTERAQAIGKVLAQGCFDVMALNETVNETRRAEIVRALQEMPAACSGAPGAGGDGQLFVISGPHLDDPLGLRRLDDLLQLLRRGQEATLDDPVVGQELTIISRLPIVETQALTFSESAGIDVGAAKGVLHARLWRGPGYGGDHVIDVFATHLQAGAYDAIRRAQLAELAQFIQDRRHPSIPLVVLGDFNVDGSQQAQADPQSAYRASLQPWAEALGLQDTGRQLEAGTEADGDERIDYIFTSGDGLHARQATVEPFLCAGMDLSFCDDAYLTLSDHAALSAELLWQHASPADTSLCDDQGAGR